MLPTWHDGASSLILLAAAHETGLLDTLTAALPIRTPTTPPGLLHMLAVTIRALMLTLLFLSAVGLRRTWDLRGYTGTALALITGRLWAYGYRHVERFLAEVARAGGAAPLTDALAGWTTHLWRTPSLESDSMTVTVYIDRHRKAVYSDQRIPRGLVARYGVILGCRALVLLHDDHGHPLLVTTARGDTHLTSGVPQILTRYEQACGRRLITRIIVDREGMGAEFLATLVAEGRTVITLLRSDQYTGLDSFTDVGAFVPFAYDRQGVVIREVAPAPFGLPRPDQPREMLPVWVALVRDLRWQVPVPCDDDAPPSHWDADLHWPERNWRDAGWEATPAPASPTMAKLIPIVATAEVGDAATLARSYFQRWPLQENVIRDFLIPLGIDTNHGYAKTEVINSEVAKRRTILEARLSKLKRWAERAGERCTRASARHQRRWEAAKARARELENLLFQRQCALEDQGVPEYVFRREMKDAQAVATAEMEQHNAAIWRALVESNTEFRKQERYCKEQREVLRALEDLTAREPQMYELENAKDQIMTVCKVAMTNLVMWTRDHYFPSTYAHATWKRLEPFFKLPGQVVWEADCVRVILHPFNDRQLNRDLVALCAQVAAVAPHLPDGRQLMLTVGIAQRLSLDGP
jgi:hypothetical protein